MGKDLKYPAFATNYQNPFYVMYNQEMPFTYDENTEWRPGINTGEVDHIKLDLDKSDEMLTHLNFVHNIKVTDNHVDIAEIVGTVKIHKENLQDLIDMFQDRLDSLSK